jgi:hypothetical protein
MQGASSFQRCCVMSGGSPRFYAACSSVTGRLGITAARLKQLAHVRGVQRKSAVNSRLTLSYH